jgi:hypothetical protein
MAVSRCDALLLTVLMMSQTALVLVLLLCLCVCPRCVPLAGYWVSLRRSSSATPSLDQAWACASWETSQRVTG